MDHIKLGYAPTRRSIFSAPDAIKYRGLTADRLTELGVDFVDITDINEEGLLYNDEDMKKIAEKFKAEKIDGLFLPHCNFGTEYICARLAKELNVEGAAYFKGIVEDTSVELTENATDRKAKTYLSFYESTHLLLQYLYDFLRSSSCSDSIFLVSRNSYTPQRCSRTR